MSSIDERIVEMRFNNKQFESGIKTSQKTLSDLQDSLKLDGATKGMRNVEDAARSFSLDGIGNAVESISSKFSVMGAIGFSVIQRLTNAALDFGRNALGSLLDPIIQGGQRRALNIEQARFQFKGLGMDVEQAMDDALYAVKNTAFGLDEAAVAASQFGASGVEAGDEMKAALRGISGVAAMAGAGYSDIADVFTKVAGQGRLMGDDLNRLGSRGINAAATLGEAMGKTEEEVRKMVSKGEVSFKDFARYMSEAFGEHATKANETYTGSLSNMRAALARIGASFASIDFENQRQIFNALTPLIDHFHDALKPVIEAFKEISGLSTKNLVAFMEALNFSEVDGEPPAIFEAMQNVVKFLLDIARPIRKAFTDMFPAVTADTIKSIAGAIRDFTERLTVSDTAANRIYRTFKGFFAILSIGWQVIKGVARVIGQLLDALSGGTGGFLDFTARIGDFFVNIDRAIKSGEGFNTFFTTMGKVLRIPIDLIIIAAGAIGDLVNNMDLVNNNPFNRIAARMQERFKGFGNIGNAVSSAWDRMYDVLRRVGAFLSPITEAIGNFFGNIGRIIGEGFQNADWSLALDAVNTGLLAGIFLAIRKFLSGGINIDFGGGFLDSVKSIFGGLTDTLSAMQAQLRAGALIKIAGAIALLAAAVLVLSLIDPIRLASALAGLSVMFGQLFVSMALFEKATAGKGFAKMPLVAASLILLSGAMILLSFAVRNLSDLDWVELAKGLSGVTVLLGVLIGVSQGLSKNASGMISTGIGMVIIAAAVKVLASAVRDFAGMEWEELGKGMASVAVALGLMGAFIKVVPAGGMILQATGLVILAVALKVFYSAVKDFASMDWADLGKGFAAVGAALALLGGFTIATKNIGGMILMGTGMVILAAALKIMASALKDFGDIPWDALGRGLVAMAGALAIIAVAIWALPVTMVATATSLVILGAALKIIASALKDFGDMSWEEIGRGLVAMAGSLLILAGAMALMGIPLVLAGSVGLTLAAFALMNLAPALKLMGSMSWDDIGRGLTMLAGSLALLAVGGVLLIPAIPAFLVLGSVALAIGLGTLAAGVGMTMMATAIVALAAAAGTSAYLIRDAILVLIGLIPEAMAAFAQGLIDFALVIAEGQTEFTAAMTTLILALIDAVDQTAPQLIDTISNLLNKLVDTLREDLPRFAEKGAEMIAEILRGIADNMEDIVTAGMDIIIAFIRGIGNRIDELIEAGLWVIRQIMEGLSRGIPELVDRAGELIIEFINGLSTAVDNNAEEIGRAGGRLAVALIRGMVNGLGAGVEEVVNAAKRVAERALAAIGNVLNINSPSKETYKMGAFFDDGFRNAIIDGSRKVGKASESVGYNAMAGLKKSIRGVDSMLDGQFDSSPTIRPVMDLSALKKGAQEIDGMMPKGPRITTNANYSDAAALMFDRRQADAKEAAPSQVIHKTELNFEQTNNSPKALSRAEIYRQTKNELSKVKEVLDA